MRQNRNYAIRLAYADQFGFSLVVNRCPLLPPKADMCTARSECPLCANSGHRMPLRPFV